MPDPSTLDPWDFAKWVGAALAGVLSWVGIDQNGRLLKLELEAQSKETAEVQRIELRDEIACTRLDVKELRNEMLAQHTRILERLDTIGDRLPSVCPLPRNV